jgi:transposase
LSETVAGVDWAKDSHRACVLDEGGGQKLARAFGHDQDGLAALVGTLVRTGVRRVAIERPDGVLVEALLAAGLEVLAIHPNQVAAARPRFRAAGGKSDEFDAYVLAELCRTDAHRFRRLVPDADETKALRALTRAREALVAQRVAAANQLRAELERFWPGALIFAEVDSQISLAFLERYPSPEDARGLGARRLGAFLARHAYCGRKRPEELLDRLRAAPRGRAGEQEVEARRGIVLSLVALLRPLVEQIRLLTSQIAEAVRAHPDGQIFLSLFRDPRSVVTAGRMLAEIGDCRERYPDAAALAADAGMCPVPIESGRSRHASFRWACDKRLRDAVGCLADASRKHNPWARELYERAVARGKDHPHAIRILGRAWLGVIWKMWQDRTAYDPTRHRALQRLIETPTRLEVSPALAAGG